MQLYSNIDEEDPKLHRMLYIFTCLSPMCIGDQRAIKVYRGYAIDKGFASGDLYNTVYNAQSDYELFKKGLILKPSEEETKDEEEEAAVDMMT